MKVSRRNFLWIAGAAVSGTLAAKLGCAPKQPPVEPGVPEPADQPVIAEDLRIQYAKTVTTVCSICGVGCGVLCYVENGKIVATEGDPDHPVSEGSLCSKGSALFNQYYVYNEKGEAVPNPQRLTKVLYRAPKAKDWEVKDWNWALETMAQRIKKTRDEYFTEKNAAGATVNRCTALAWLGSAMCTNEENYLFQKLGRALGITNLDHCARL
ncbi:MAG: hypothetical protein AB1796_08665 [Bacillota bacterium]